MSDGALQLVAEPQRFELLSHLAASDRRVGDLVELTGRAQNLLSYHLKELKSAGLVSSRRSSHDGRDVYYRLEIARYARLMDEASTALHPGLRVAEAPPALPARRAKVLFLCTGNSARSQIAEALMTHRTGGRIEARSAGSHPKGLHPNAVRVMAERGIDIAGRPTKHVDRFARSRFDRVITLCDKVKEICPTFPGAPAAHWSMADPSEGSYRDFVATADEIDGRLGLLIAQLAHGKARS